MAPPGAQRAHPRVVVRIVHEAPVVHPHCQAVLPGWNTHRCEAMTIDQLMRRMAGQLRDVVYNLEHPSQANRTELARKCRETLDDLHKVAAKLRAVRRELGEPEGKP